MSKLQFVEKRLGRNELGHTGSHQSGMLVPKLRAIIDFFPPLPESEFNPRRVLHCWNRETDRFWALNYIYYNGKPLGLSSRNEYRLTGTTPFFRDLSADQGDVVRFEYTDRGLEVSLRRESKETHVPATGRLTISMKGDWFYEREDDDDFE